jgi:hypothetical protein
MYYDPDAPNLLSSAGPGHYDVYTDSFGHAHGTSATSAKPFPSGTIVPIIAAYPYATGCQTTWAKIIGGFPYYFPAYGTALPDASGNFVCHAAAFRLGEIHVNGSLPYAVAVDS